MDVALQNENVIQHIQCHGIDATTKYMSDKFAGKCTYKQLSSHITRLHQKYKSLLKSKSRVKGKENLDRFMTSAYTLPVSDVLDKSSCSSSNSNTRTLPFSDCDDVNLKAQAYKSVAEKLADELVTVKNNLVETEEELGAVIDEKDELNDSLEQNLNYIDIQKKNLKRTSNRELYWRGKCEKVQKVDTELDTIQELKLYISSLKETLSKKNDEIKTLKSVIDDLNIENMDLKAVENVEFFNENTNTYIPQLHTCVYSLLDCHIASENVSKCIQSVLKLINKEANKLPAPSTINNWSVERALLSRRHVASTCEQENTTLHTDEASKYGNKWGAFATRNNDGEYMLLGLRDMATKSAADTLDTFKEILDDIDLATETEESDAGKKLLANIKNTMSDRAATETKFNNILKEYRESILPDVMSNYETLNEESKQSIAQMNNFFCGLHTLVHMADVSQKSVYQVEKTHFDDDIPISNPKFKKSGQSGAERLIHCACKAFARRGDQKNGCHQAFKTFISDFLKENNLLGLPLQPLKGNRFNILFTNAAHVYFLKDKMLEYLEKSNTTTSNGLLVSVLHDLKIPIFVAACKALGLVSKLITTPLWRVIENKNVSISQMNERYRTLLSKLNSSVDHLDDFIRGNFILYDDIPIKKDYVYDKLIEPSEIDGTVVLILSVVIPALTKLIQHQYGDHLTGGRHEVLDEIQTASVDKHNKYPERVFSYVDHVLASKPNIKTLALEAQISFSLNKTINWLEAQENSSEIIEQVRGEVKLERRRFKERGDVILAKRIEKQEEDFRKKHEQEQRRIEKLERETTDMLYYGLWQSKAQVEEELLKIKSRKEKEDALKVQLRFRKNVFKQKSENSDVYLFSKAGVPLTYEQLKTNVESLIDKSYNTPPPEQPHILVGKNIQHKWLSETGAATWYTGRVISQVPGFEQWFNVVYEGDDAVYTAKLGEEWKDGDVIVTC